MRPPRRDEGLTRWPLFLAAGACITAGVGLFSHTDPGRDLAAAFLLALGAMLAGAALALHVARTVIEDSKPLTQPLHGPRIDETDPDGMETPETHQDKQEGTTS